MLIFLSATTATFAADPAADYDGGSQAYEWSGLYAGASAGYAWQKGRLYSAGTSTSVDFDGARLSVFGGYNFELAPSFIMGIEGEIGHDWSDYTTAAGGGELGTFGSVRARLGFAANRALFYVAGGYAFAEGKETVGGVTASATPDGWTLGAGVDFAMTEKMFLRAEYRHNDLKTGLNAFGSSWTNTLKQDVVNIGLGVKF